MCLFREVEQIKNMQAYFVLGLHYFAKACQYIVLIAKINITFVLKFWKVVNEILLHKK